MRAARLTRRQAAGNRFSADGPEASGISAGMTLSDRRVPGVLTKVIGLPPDDLVGKTDLGPEPALGVQFSDAPASDADFVAGLPLAARAG